MAETSYAAPAASRLLDMVELLADEREGLSMTEIGRRLAISTNSVFRISRVLEERGYVDRNPATNLLRLSTKLYTVGARAVEGLDILDRGQPLLDWLAAETGESAHLCILREGWLVLLAQSVTHNPIRVVVETGALLHAHSSAFGKVILANLTAEERGEFLSHDLTQLTDRTVTDAEALEAQLATVQREGIAYDLEEYMTGVRCIGGPVYGANSTVVAGMGVMGPSYRLPMETLEGFAPIVREASTRLSRALGSPI